ncbi:MAG: hypothetical protein ABIJ18_01190 [archaeon]
MSEERLDDKKVEGLHFLVSNCLSTNKGVLEYHTRKYCLLSALDCPYQSPCKEHVLDYCRRKNWNLKY